MTGNSSHHMLNTGHHNCNIAWDTGIKTSVNIIDVVSCGVIYLKCTNAMVHDNIEITCHIPTKTKIKRSAEIQTSAHAIFLYQEKTFSTLSTDRGILLRAFIAVLIPVIAKFWKYIEYSLYYFNMELLSSLLLLWKPGDPLTKESVMQRVDVAVNTLRPRQDGRHFADDIFTCICLNENVWIPIDISLKFVPMGPINNIPAMVQIMAWRRPGDKPLSEPMVVSLPTHICVARPQWVKVNKLLNVSSMTLMWHHCNGVT